MSKPLYSDGESRPFSFRIPLSADEQRMLHELARHEGRSGSEMLRRMIKEAHAKLKNSGRK